MRDHILDTIDYCKTAADPTRTLNLRLKELFPEVGEQGEDIVMYSFRHAARNNFVTAEINFGMMKACLGWAGGDQSLAMQYGAKGIEQSAFIKSVNKGSRKAYAHIIEALS